MLELPLSVPQGTGEPLADVDGRKPATGETTPSLEGGICTGSLHISSCSSVGTGIASG